MRGVQSKRRVGVPAVQQCLNTNSLGGFAGGGGANPCSAAVKPKGEDTLRGDGAARAVRQGSPCCIQRSVDVFPAFSMYSDILQETQHAARAAPFTGWIQKPFREDTTPLNGTEQEKKTCRTHEIYHNH